MKDAYRTVGRELKRDLNDLAKVEAKWAANGLSASVEAAGLNLGVGLAEGELLRQIVAARPFQGALLRDWAAKLERDAFTRVAGAIRQGMLQGESIDKIVRRLRGTRAGKFADGILAISRREAEAIARTAVSHVANGARDAVWAANEDLISGLQWVATLDSRTCEICIPRDGKLYSMEHRPIGHSVPWSSGPGRMHMNDRCTSVPVMKSWKELGIDADEVTGEQRAALDGFVPAETKYPEWIAGQSVSVQDEVLGKRRGQLLRAGELKTKDLFDRRGELVSLDELAQRPGVADFLSERASESSVAASAARVKPGSSADAGLTRVTMRETGGNNARSAAASVQAKPKPSSAKVAADDGPVRVRTAAGGTWTG